MYFSIDANSSQPIYRQLSQQIREQVARGQLAPEVQLPSVRELSRTLVVNPNTISRVYIELEREGVLTTRPGQGVYIAKPRIELTKAVRVEKLQEQMRDLLTSAVYLGFDDSDVRKMLEDHLPKYNWKLIKGNK